MARRRTPSSNLPFKLGELAIAAPLVVAHRLGRTADPREMQRMSHEKVAAFYESWAAMALQVATLQQKALWSAMWGMWRPPTAAAWQRDASRVLGRGLAPVHRRAVANAKRLGR